MTNTKKLDIEIPIPIPEGYQFDSVDTSNGTIKLKAIPKDIKEQITSFSDVLKINGVKKKDFQESCDGLEPDEVAYKMAKEVAKAYNQGWVPDWTNSNEYKYFPWFKMGSSSGVGFSFFVAVRWSAYSTVGSRLCFKTSEKAEHAGKQFIELYKAYFVKA